MLAAGRPGIGNRERWTRLGDDPARPVWLRWQRMRDPVLARRLPPSIAPAAWRAFIDGFVFFSVRREAAEAFAAWPADRAIDQVVLEFDTAAVLGEGHAPRFCRWNNGFPDRCRPPRIRGFEDYRPVAAWRRGEAVKEVVVPGRVSAPFRIIAPRRRAV